MVRSNTVHLIHSPLLQLLLELCRCSSMLRMGMLRVRVGKRGLVYTVGWGLRHDDHLALLAL